MHFGTVAGRKDAPPTGNKENTPGWLASVSTSQKSALGVPVFHGSREFGIP